jgi:hypothetical protein
MFVFFGWFALAVFGVSLQILGRMGELFKGYEDLCGLEVTLQGASVAPAAAAAR